MTYRAALRAAGARPAEAVFIGDGWRSDMLGSVSLGMSAVYVDRRGSQLAETPAGIARVQDLRCLPELIG